MWTILQINDVYYICLNKIINKIFCFIKIKGNNTNFNWGQNYTLPSLELVWPNS